MGYLPAGDDDDFDFQWENISEVELYEIISQKTANRELVGVYLFYRAGDEELILLASDTKHIMLDISGYRRVIDGRHTDMVWYLENVVYKLLETGIKGLGYKLEEFED